MINNMNSEMKTNVQLSTTESKKQKQTKQITRIGITEMENTWRGISGEVEGGDKGKRYRESEAYMVGRK